MNAVEVAKYLLGLSDPNEHDITNMKLQKLLYFAQGLFLALKGKPIFKEEIQAWKHGPVVPAAYEEFCEAGNRIIPIPADAHRVKPGKETAEFLQDIFKVYGQYSAAKLSAITHSEGPWKTKKGHYEPISQTELKTFFETKVAAFIDEVELIEDNDLARDFEPSPRSDLIPHSLVMKKLG